MKSASRRKAESAEAELKQRVLHTLTKLLDLDTQKKAYDEMILIIKNMQTEHLPTLLTCVIEATKESIRLFGVVAYELQTELMPHIPKVVATVIKRFKDSESSVQEACAEALGCIADMAVPQNSTTAAINQLLVMPLMNVLAEKNKLLQGTAALCLSKVLPYVTELDSSMIKLINRLLRYLESPTFEAKAPLVAAITALIQVDGEALLPHVDSLVGSAPAYGGQDDSPGSGLLSVFGSHDWSARKSAAEAIKTLGMLLGESLPEEVVSTACAGLEDFRFDKVKPVREEVAEALKAHAEADIVVQAPLRPKPKGPRQEPEPPQHHHQTISGEDFDGDTAAGIGAETPSETEQMSSCPILAGGDARSRLSRRAAEGAAAASQRRAAVQEPVPAAVFGKLPAREKHRRLTAEGGADQVLSELDRLQLELQAGAPGGPKKREGCQEGRAGCIDGGQDRGPEMHGHDTGTGRWATDVAKDGQHAGPSQPGRLFGAGRPETPSGDIRSGDEGSAAYGGVNARATDAGGTRESWSCAEMPHAHHEGIGGATSSMNPSFILDGHADVDVDSLGLYGPEWGLIAAHISSLQKQQAQMIGLMQDFDRTSTHALESIEGRVRRLEAKMPQRQPPPTPSRIPKPPGAASQREDLLPIGQQEERAARNAADDFSLSAEGKEEYDTLVALEMEAEYATVLEAGDEFRMMQLLRQSGPVALQLSGPTLTATMTLLLSLLSNGLYTDITLSWLEQLVLSPTEYAIFSEVIKMLESEDSLLPGGLELEVSMEFTGTPSALDSGTSRP
eukprot:gene2392-3122_t